MKKKIIIISSIVIFIGIIGLILLLQKKDVIDENTLYSVKINETILRIERYDYSLGQNQIVGVEKSLDNGKTYEKLTNEGIIVSMEPMFTFLDENQGFIISKANLSSSNEYLGFKVTNDGGKTFSNAIINYDNPDIEVLTITSVPYKENNYLILPCSIYQVKEDKSGYENKTINFISNDNGITWNLYEKESDNVNKINIIINDITYEANLEDNETVKEFIKLLPKEFSMNELNGNEKYVYLENNLPTNAINPKFINKGDIYVYGNNCLVIFYKSFETSYSYTKIGHIDNLPDLGNDSIKVKIEKQI